MPQLLIDSRSGAPTCPQVETTLSTQTRSHRRVKRERPAEDISGVANEDDLAARPTSTERLSVEERGDRSTALVRQLECITTLDEFVALAHKHGRLQLVRAASDRPDLIPVVNGEFAYIALSLADLD